MENTEKRWDSYDVTDKKTWPDALNKKIFETKVGGADTVKSGIGGADTASPNNTYTDEQEALITSRYAYAMPCFGLTVNRGNNYIFKSINVNMDSPKITAAAAQTWSDILTKTGADGSKRVFFHGQDIYSIYSQYAYACEVEMLGCAQIQPLMYFQLLNIPMWRGSYMIYKVSHNMTPGNMVTKFVGMKMSRYQTPFADGYFTIGKQSKGGSQSSDGTSNSQSVGTGNGAVGGDEMIKTIFGNYTDYKISKNFDEYRGKSKKTGKPHYHQGVDISAKEGTPLYAPWDGTVTFTRNGSETAGNYLHFTDSSNKCMVIYMHCQKLNCKKGDTVKAGSVLAYVGCTGSNAVKNGKMPVHLHLELYINGKFTTGELVKHGGSGQAVDPTISYGGITVEKNSNQYINNSNEDTNPIIIEETERNTATEKKDEVSKPKSTKNFKINACIIGDGWAVGMVSKHFFSYHAVKSGMNEGELNASMKRCTKGNGYNKIVLHYLSFPYNNDYPQYKYFSESSVKRTLKWIMKPLTKSNKYLYICTVPTNLRGGTNNCLDSYSIKVINNAIRSNTSLGYKVIEIPDSVTTDNLKNGYLLKNYTKVAEIIQKSLG